MIALFKQRSPANIALLFIFGLLVKLPLFLYPRAIVTTDNDGKLYHAFVDFINSSGSDALLASIIAFILLYVQALMINYLVNEYRMTMRQTFLPGMAYLLITSLLPEWSFLSAALVANTFIILLLIGLLRLYNVPAANSKIFNVGLLAGLTSFLFFPSFLFVGFVLLALLILRAFRLNEWVLFLMGAATPYYFYAVYLFLTNRFSMKAIFPNLYIQVPEVERSLWLVGAVILLCVPFLMGGYFVQTQLRKMLIQARKNWSILLLYLLFAFLVPFVNSTGSFHTWVLTAAPFAGFHACAYLYPARKWVPTILFFIILAFVILQQYVTNAWQ